MAGKQKWLQGEIDRWVAEGLIPTTTGSILHERYAPRTARLQGGMVFAVIGAILVGLGIILFFAANWQAIPKWGKLTAVAVAFFAAQGGGLYLVRRDERSLLAEVLFVLGSMLLGAAIWLVAQVYHIQSHFPNGLLAWGMGVTLAAWVRTSIPQVIMAVILLTVWGMTEAIGFDHAMHWSPLVIVAAAAPLLWIKRSPVVLALLMAAIGVLTTTLVANDGDAGYSVFHLFLFVATATGLAAVCGGWPRVAWVAPTMNVIGLAPFWLICYLATFHGIQKEILGDWIRHERGMTAWLVGAIIVALLAWGGAIWLRRSGIGQQLRAGNWQFVLMPLTIVVVDLLIILPGRMDREVLVTATTAFFNLLFLLQAILLVVRGMRGLDARLMAAGCGLVALLAVTRYADLFDDLLARSAVFLLVGGAILVTGLLFARRKKNLAGGRS